jgi:hypothetical protein
MGVLQPADAGGMAGAVGRACIALLLLAAAAFAGCGGGDDGNGSDGEAAALAVPWVDPDGDPPYIGELSVNPADGALFMSTNTGLFRIERGGNRPEKVTGTLTTPEGRGEISAGLVVRFTGPDQALGSGHPAAGTALPPVLGLIRTADAARTWESVSELGTADFHAIEPDGQRIAAALFGESRILLSNDGGRTWESRAAPTPLVDLEVDPGNPEHWMAASDRGIFFSTDAGGTWRQRDPTPNVRAVWAAPDELYRIDPGGPVKVSADGGESWEDRGSTGGEPQAFTIDEQGTFYVALFDGTVTVSEDGGRTWTVRVQGG